MISLSRVWLRFLPLKMLFVQALHRMGLILGFGEFGRREAICIETTVSHTLGWYDALMLEEEEAMSRTARTLFLLTMPSALCGVVMQADKRPPRMTKTSLEYRLRIPHGNSNTHSPREMAWTHIATTS